MSGGVSIPLPAPRADNRRKKV